MARTLSEEVEKESATNESSPSGPGRSEGSDSENGYSSPTLVGRRSARRRLRGFARELAAADGEVVHEIAAELPERLAHAPGPGSPSRGADGREGFPRGETKPPRLKETTRGTTPQAGALVVDLARTITVDDAVGGQAS